MGGGQPAAYAAFRWSGWFWPERDGRHEFSLRGPGEMRLWLDGAPLIDEGDAGQPGQARPRRRRSAPRKTAAVELVAGRGYPIRVEYVRALPSRAEQAARPTDASAGLAWEYVSLGVRAPRGSIAEAAELAASCDAAVVVIGSASISEGEGYDREDLDLPGDQNALVEAVLAANPRTVVVLSNGAPYALPWIDHAPAVIEAWMGGEAGPDAVARIILGEAEPSGRLPVTFPAALEDSPAQAFYPGGDMVTYGEGLRVGYRHFDAGNEPPLFPFGFGLTYTKFSYARPRGAGDGAGRRISPGDVHADRTSASGPARRRPSSTCGRAGRRPTDLSRNSKASPRLRYRHGRPKIVRIDLDARAFAFYDPASGAWVVEPGAYDLLIGGSAADIELQATVRLEDCRLTRPELSNPGRPRMKYVRKNSHYKQGVGESTASGLLALA